MGLLHRLEVADEAVGFRTAAVEVLLARVVHALRLIICTLIL